MVKNEKENMHTPRCILLRRSSHEQASRSIFVGKWSVCVVCFLRCFLSLHLSFVWNYSYYTSTELLARYKFMWISLFTSICLPNVFRKNPPSPHFSHKNICNSLLCDDLLRKLQRGVCIFSFSFFTTCVEVILCTQTL